MNRIHAALKVNLNWPLQFCRNFKRRRQTSIPPTQCHLMSSGKSTPSILLITRVKTWLAGQTQAWCTLSSQASGKLALWGHKMCTKTWLSAKKGIWTVLCSHLLFTKVRREPEKFWVNYKRSRSKTVSRWKWTLEATKSMRSKKRKSPYP